MIHSFTPELFVRELPNLDDRHAEVLVSHAEHIDKSFRQACADLRALSGPMPEQGRAAGLQRARVTFAKACVPIKDSIAALEREADRVERHMNRPVCVPSGVEPGVWNQGTLDLAQHMRAIGQERALELALERAAAGDSQPLRAIQRAPAARPLVPKDAVSLVAEAYYGAKQPADFKRYQSIRAVAASLRGDLNVAVKRLAKLGFL